MPKKETDIQTLHPPFVGVWGKTKNTTPLHLHPPPQTHPRRRAAFHSPKGKMPVHQKQPMGALEGMTEGVLVETGHDGLGEGQSHVEVEHWVKKGKGKKRKTKAMCAIASALLSEISEEAGAYLWLAGLGKGQAVDDGDIGVNGVGGGTKGGDGAQPGAPSPATPDMESDNGTPRARQGQGLGQGQGHGQGQGNGRSLGVPAGCPNMQYFP